MKYWHIDCKDEHGLPITLDIPWNLHKKAERKRQRKVKRGQDGFTFNQFMVGGRAEIDLGRQAENGMFPTRKFALKVGV